MVHLSSGENLYKGVFMNTHDFKRRLTAILSADVVGYSRLMREDEDATIRTIKLFRGAISKLIQDFRGRVVDAPGDNILADFTSVVDAVNCAVEIQRDLAERNAELPENRRMEFRIGVNMGDVVEEGDRLYGDGINIAARMESLAQAGGICISGTVYDGVEKKLGLEYEYLGEKEVKNIETPVRVYRVLSYPGAAAHRVIRAKKTVGVAWRNAVVSVAALLILGVAAFSVWHYSLRPAATPMEVASVEKMAFPLPDKPSIAVLPFINMSGDPEQEYFSDGLTDQIISGLSKVPNLFVIARNSSFTYKGKPVKVQKVAEDLGVRFILEGSVQKTADRIRITAQLIDAITGHHRWSKRYDRDLEDIFAIQDDITLELMNAMAVELRGDEARVWTTHVTTNLEAYEKYLEGFLYSRRFTKEDSARARQLFKEAIVLDSQFATAYAMLGWGHFWDARFGWTEFRVKSIKMAFESAQKALEIDDTTDLAHSLLSALYVVKGQHEKAVTAAEHALTLSPNGALQYCTVGAVVGSSGRWKESVIYGKKSVRLDPLAPPVYFHWLGRAYFMTGQYDEAIVTLKKALHINPNYLPAHAFLGACYSSLDRKAEAAAEAEEVMKLNPKFSLESYARTLPYKNKADVDRYIEALRKAGLPEIPPLPLPDKPSIAVLPFVNMSGDPEQEYFSDGISEEIITALSKVRDLFVIARNSTFTYKGKPVKVQQVSRELGVRYVLEGSVRKSSDRLRITAQLVDALTGKHVWAERYDRDLKDIFALQDEITIKILTALQVTLTNGQEARLYAKGTDNLDAYLKRVQATEYFHHLNKDDNFRARKTAEQAIALDQGYAAAYAILGWTYAIDARIGWSKSKKHCLERAEELARKAMALDDALPDSYRLLSFIYLTKGQFEKAIVEVKRAIAINPDATSYANLGMALVFACRPEEAIASLKKAIRINPIPPSYYYLKLARAYRMTGKYEKALAECRKALSRSPDNIFARAEIAATYSLSGREEEARTAAAEVLRLHPTFTVERYVKGLPFKKQSENERLANALYKAGLK